MSKHKTVTELLVETMVNYAKYGTSYPTQEQIEEKKKAEAELDRAKSAKEKPQPQEKS